jgi:hypothetical protein
VLGVSVNVVGGDKRLRLSNYSGQTVVVLGYTGEPFLRFSKNGVFRNARSPSTASPVLAASRDRRQLRLARPPHPLAGLGAAGGGARRAGQGAFGLQLARAGAR